MTKRANLTTIKATECPDCGHRSYDMSGDGIKRRTIPTAYRHCNECAA